MGKRLRHSGKRLGLAAFGLGVAVLALEIACRVLPVHEGFHRLSVTADDPVLRFEADRRFICSSERNFAIVAKKRSNNLGYLSDYDYEGPQSGPVLAFIGDSFVEAAQVDNAEAMHGRIGERLASAGMGAALPFAVAGSPLSQYLTFAEYARDTCAPTSCVVVVVQNDFDESLARYKQLPGYFYFVESEDGRLVRELVEYRPALIKRVARSSALVRYLIINGKFDWLTLEQRILGWWDELWSSDDGQPPVSAPVAAAPVETRSTADAQPVLDARERLSFQTIDVFLERLPAASGVSPERTLIVMDAVRPHVYWGNHEEGFETYYGKMRTYLAAQAKAAGYEVVDMHPVFREHFMSTGEGFQFPTDFHWNGAAHRLVAEAIEESAVYRDFAKGTSSP